MSEQKTSGRPSADGFRALHGKGLLLVPNAWDVASALLFERAGAKAVATSSAAMAWSLGYADGEEVPLADLLDAVDRITKRLKVPLTVDFERGYGRTPKEVAESVVRLVEVGAAGVNLEDAAGSPDALARRIAAVRARSPKVFINARTCIVLKNAVEADKVIDEALSRAQQYRSAGADGFFVPGLTDAAQIEAIARGCEMPLNLFVSKGLPPIAELTKLGVRRLTTGPRLAEVAYSAASAACEALLAGETATLLGSKLGFGALEGLYR